MPYTIVTSAKTWAHAHKQATHPSKVYLLRLINVCKFGFSCICNISNGETPVEHGNYKHKVLRARQDHIDRWADVRNTGTYLTSCNPAPSLKDADGSLKSRISVTSPRESDAKRCTPAQLRMDTTKAFRVACITMLRMVSNNKNINHVSTAIYRTLARPQEQLSILHPWARRFNR